jgi:hypothetical protein
LERRLATKILEIHVRTVLEQEANHGKPVSTIFALAEQSGMEERIPRKMLFVGI